MQREVFGLEKIVEGRAENGGDFARIEAWYHGLFNERRVFAGGFAIGMEEGDAGRDHEVGSGEGRRERAKPLYSERFRESVVVLGQTNLLRGFTTGNLICPNISCGRSSI